MSSFNPIRTPNAVDQAVFVVKLSCNISNLYKDELKLLNDQLRGQFDTFNDVTISGVQFTPDGIKQPETHFGGIECRSAIQKHEHLLVEERPDWILRIVENSIQVNCLNYSSWSETCNYVNTLLAKVFASLPLEDKSFIEIALQINDTFISIDELDQLDLTELFSKSKYLTDNVFKRGLLWHVHSGWFESSEDAKTLHVLNISTQAEHSEPAKYIVQIEHLQKYTANTAVLVNQDPTLLSNIFENLHTNNKALVSELLSDEIKGRIGL